MALQFFFKCNRSFTQLETPARRINSLCIYITKMKTAALIVIIAAISSVTTSVSANNDLVDEFDSHTLRFLMSLPKAKAAKEAKAAKAKAEKGSEDGAGVIHEETMSSDEKETKAAKGHKVFKEKEAKGSKDHSMRRVLLSDFDVFDSHTRGLSVATTSHDGKVGKVAKSAKAKGSKDGSSMRLLLTDFMNEFDNN